MARTKLSILSNKTKRLALEVSKTPHYEPLSGGISIGYRRNKAAGAWVGRRYDDGQRTIRNLGIADDYADADGTDVLSYDQACKMVMGFDPKKEDREAAIEAAFPTVFKAVAQYEADLKIRGGDRYNATRLLKHIDAKFGETRVSALTKSQCRDWRDGLKEKLEGATIDRICNALRAALNLVADRAGDKAPVSRDPWEFGLKTVGGSQSARNVILSVETISAIIAGAYRHNVPFGNFAEVLAETGTRPSQAGVLLVRDLIGGPHDPKLLMPRSKKGKAGKDLTPTPVPITVGLAAKLRAEASGRAPDDFLLLKQPPPIIMEQIKKGKIPNHIVRYPWSKSDHVRPFSNVVGKVFGGQDAVDGYPLDEVTIYSFRHSSIVRQLLGGIPIRVVATHHDTSVGMIEKHYSAFISGHADSLVRSNLKAF